MNELVTLATFPNPPIAGFISSLLNEGGIRAYLADERSTGTLWHLSTSIGWVKVQVAEADVAQASEFLDECRQTAAGLGSDQFAAIATSAPILDTHLSDTEPADAVAIEDQTEGQTVPTDDHASRTYRAAVLGLMSFPFMLYGMWLIFRLLLKDGELSVHASRKLWQACAMTFVALLGIWILFRGAASSIGIYQYPYDWSKDVIDAQRFVRSRLLPRDR